MNKQDNGDAVNLMRLASSESAIVVDATNPLVSRGLEDLTFGQTTSCSASDPGTPPNAPTVDLNQAQKESTLPPDAPNELKRAVMKQTQMLERRAKRHAGTKHLNAFLNLAKLFAAEAAVRQPAPQATDRVLLDRTL